MNEELRRRYVRDLVADLQQVGGARFEQWIRPLWDQIAGAPVEAHGLNLEGSPIPGHLDGRWPDGSVAEATSEKSYFKKPYEKPRHDFAHARAEAPDARIIRLFCSRESTAPALRLAGRAKSRLARLGFELDLWHGRRIAEYIVDELLLDERFVERVGDTLPNLRRISEQAAASARLPDQEAGYRPRPEEEDLVRQLRQHPALVLAGMGGVGKTELACAVAHRVRDDFELVIWVDADRVDRLEALTAYDVRLNGYRLNILDLLRSHCTLLVLDNVSADLDVARLEAECGRDSRVLITSQVEFGPRPYCVGFLGRESARAVLSEGAATPCPDTILDAILAAVDGHPLILRLLNRFAVEGHEWELIGDQCATATGLPDEKRRTVAARILERHLEVLGPELAFFSWCEGPRIDRTLYIRMFGLGGISKLERWALTARGQSDAVRLHDVVYASVERLRSKLPIDDQAFETGLEAHLAASLSPKGLTFFRVINRHRDLLRARLAKAPRPGALRYAYLHSRNPADLEAQLIGDPAADVQAGPIGERQAWLLSVVESVEADYRRVRDQGDVAGAKATLEQRLKVFDELTSSGTLTSTESAIVLHHRAKSLLKLGKVDEALQGFETVLADGHPHFATRLQIARLLGNDAARAKALVFEIIQAEFDHPGIVSTSVLIETLATLRRSHLRRAAGEMTERYGPFMAQQIKAAACSGETQPVRAFAAVGPEWSYKAPNLFIEVLEEIDLGLPEDAEDDDERVAIGRLLTAAGKMLLRDRRMEEARQRFELSASFFAAVTRRTGFVATHHADALLRLGRSREAGLALEAVPENNREVFWRLRRSEAHLDLGELPEALAVIDQALAGDLAEFRPTFLAQRAEIRRALGQSDHFDILASAISECNDPQYRADLERRLGDWRAGAA